MNLYTIGIGKTKYANPDLYFQVSKFCLLWNVCNSNFYNSFFSPKVEQLSTDTLIIVYRERAKQMLFFYTSARSGEIKCPLNYSKNRCISVIYNSILLFIPVNLPLVFVYRFMRKEFKSNNKENLENNI